MVDTAQYRTKVYIAGYWVAADITKDNGIDLASMLIAFDWPDYPLTRVFIDKAIDAVISVGQASSNVILDANHYPIGYHEKVPITLATMDKAGITGIKLLAKLEAELRKISEVNPLGSVRRITGEQPKTQRLGAFYLFSSEYVMDYKRDLT